MKKRINRNNKIQFRIISISTVIMLLCVIIIEISINKSTAYAFETNMNDLMSDIDNAIDNKRHYRIHQIRMIILKVMRTMRI